MQNHVLPGWKISCIHLQLYETVKLVTCSKDKRFLHEKKKFYIVNFASLIAFSSLLSARTFNSPCYDAKGQITHVFQPSLGVLAMLHLEFETSKKKDHLE